MKKILWSKIILVCLFIFTFLILISVSKKDSATTDEGVHLFAGFTYLTKNDFRLDTEHPPLLKEMAALPLLFKHNLQTSIDGLWDKAGNFYYDSWQETRSLAESFMFSLGNNAEKLVFWGRFPFIILTMFLGLAVYWWARKLYGEAAGVFAAFLILLLPSVLAHGHLINTDLGLTLFLFLTVYFWTKFLKKPNWTYLLFSGLFLGFSFASKFTSAIGLPILLVLFLGKLFFYDADLKNWRRYLEGFAGVVILGFLVTWAAYGFSVQVPPPPLEGLAQNINAWTNFNVPSNYNKLYAIFRSLLFPADLYKGIFLIGRHALGGHGSFLLGQLSNTGWWYYFPVAIFFKTPLPFFVFFILALVFQNKLRAKEKFDELALLAAPIIFLMISMFSKADLGVRHVLPIFPFLAVYAAKSINLVKFKLNIWTVGFVILIGWHLWSSISAYPNYLAYFNEAAGGPSNGYNILVDSNLDWGQDYTRIKKYLDDHQINEGYILYPWDGNEALKYYGINLKQFNWGDRSMKGYVIVSATYYQLAELHWLDLFPREQITHGVFIFDLR